ncbi:MAG: AAA family ATPase [Planctomycetaceae bacterium]|nr:AAA family ATPase [Planctomycetaceae bacterium]
MTTLAPEQAEQTERIELIEAPRSKELSAVQTDAAISLDQIDFDDTRALEPLGDELIGQNRAMTAIQLGLGIRKEGYNIFVTGLTGSERSEIIRRSIEKRLTGEPVPDDWVYVNNFDNPGEPWAIRLRPTEGRKLKKHMDRLLERLIENLPKAFRQQDFSHEKDNLSRKYQTEIQKHTAHLKTIAAEQNFDVSFGPGGGVTFVPLSGGAKMEDQEQLEKLPAREQERIRQGEEKLLDEVNRIMQEQHEIMDSISEEIRQVERRFAQNVINPLIESIKHEFGHNQRVLDYLGKVAEHILDNLSDFREDRERTGLQNVLASMGMDEETVPRFLEYQVNVIVDQSHNQTTPILIEETPTYQNLFGEIERSVDRRGRLSTNFSQIKAGSLLRANGGYLIFNIEDALTEPFVYKSLKRTLKTGCVQLETYNPWLPFSTSGIRPEPIPITTKVVVIGSPLMYYLLCYYDEEFSSIFKVKADFDQEMPDAPFERKQYGRFIADVVQREKLLPFSRRAVVEIFRFSARQVGKQDKLYSRLSEITDLLREADYFARTDTASMVEDGHVRQALNTRIYLGGRIAEKIRELIEDGTILLDMDEPRIGQINGLAVISLGDLVFGKPTRITTSVGLGSEGVINIEREAKMSGSIHDKGIMILGGYLRNQYGRHTPLALTASICLEQSYSGVEGDSASAAELFALISNIAQVPLRQDIAVTGSVNQRGQVQAIGGVNEKIEGFYDTCKVLGLSGRQGVCIPASNIQNLILRDDVRAAIEQGRFHIYPIETIDQGLELLTGIKAGAVTEKGTLHWLASNRFSQMALDLKQMGVMSLQLATPSSAQPQIPPSPPRYPGDQP